MSYQFRFHQQWQHLHDPHVRSLAWLLTSPELLNTRAPLWRGAIASLELPARPVLTDWLTQLDRQPTALHESLKLHKHHRLGLYAENLFAYYLRHFGLLYAHSLQVHDAYARTIGEFDFLLHGRYGLLHWELATKFYLFDLADTTAGAADLYDYLGPGLADTLGAKMEKILQQQLQLSAHPLAQALLPKAVAKAQALIKGWLFYRDMTLSRAENLVDGIAPDHCRGYIWTLGDVTHLDFEHGMVLERLAWLPPAQAREDLGKGKTLLLDMLQRYFRTEKAPLMLALMSPKGDVLQETSRGMVVPDDWWVRAAELRLQLRPD